MKINKLKINKKILITSGLALLIILFCCAAYAVQGDSLAKLFGKQQAEIIANAGDGIVATINGMKITKKVFDSYKLFTNSGENKFSDSQILDKIIDRQVIYGKALQEGISVTDEEVTNAIKTAQNAIKQDNAIYTAFKDYFSGLNMTEDQYWESVKPVYKKALICGKFKNALKEKYAKDNKIENQMDLNNKFRDYYDQYVKDLKSKAKVETDIK